MKMRGRGERLNTRRLRFTTWGPEEGAGATIWARAVRDNLELHESARARWATTERDLETWERLHATALILVVAMDQILAFADRVARLTGGAELARARADFDNVATDTGALRDLVAHLDEYAVGEGWRQQGKRQPPISEKYVSALMWWLNGGGTMLRIGEEEFDLRSAASQAIELAEVVERVRAEYLRRAGDEADAALLEPASQRDRGRLCSCKILTPRRRWEQRFRSRSVGLASDLVLA
jgi:hypothetical protein